MLNYTINDRAYHYHHSIEETLSFSPQTNYLFNLDYLTVLEVEGLSANEFLQGQLTCNLNEIDEKHMRQGALCNLKGRILALLDIIYWQGFHLVLPKDLLNDTQTSLNKAAIFSKVKLHQTPSIQLFGLYYQNPLDHSFLPFQLPDEIHTVYSNHDLCCYKLGPQLYIILVTNTEIASSWVGHFPHMKSDLAWHYLCLQHQYIEIYPNTRGLFLPHRLNLHHKGYVSFDKGCYKGQEIIARMHFRGAVKHELQLFTIDTEIKLEAGMRLFDVDTEKEMGEIVDCCPLSLHRMLIAVSILPDHTKQCIINNTRIELRPFTSQSH